MAYIETCIVDNQVSPGIGVLNPRNLRVNPNSHLLYSAFHMSWKPEYGSRIRGYHSNENNKLIILDHDDIDCLEDLESENLIEIISLINLYVKLTDLGQSIVSQIRSWKVHGNGFSNFVPKLENERN